MILSGISDIELLFDLKHTQAALATQALPGGIVFGQFHLSIPRFAAAFQQLLYPRTSCTLFL